MNFSVLLFSYFLILGPLMSISSSNWIVCWGGMELGFFALMPLLLMSNLSLSKEVVLKYFSIQAFSSVLLFFSGMMIFSFMIENIAISVMFLLSMSLKLGFFPGHFWVPSVVAGLDWFSCCLIMGPLKIAPLALCTVFLNSFPSFQLTVMSLGVLSAIYGSILGNNQTNIRSMIGASSISHTGWMINALIFGQMWIYFLVYMITLFMFLLMMMKLDYFNAMMNLLSMSGLPPFFVFVVKINVLFSMAQVDAWLLISLLIMGSMISLVFYLKFSYSLILSNKSYKAFYLYVFLMLNLLGAFFIF
uniref:NADH-ubiquinone oxidoreductase chain 2 n=1 Tax=Ampullaceana lagotis TaxID=161081 RepID=A0A7S8CV37_9GAST|nr:NADH dehydrogenase subunit 2 [Ampullaceana lagotis]QPC56779.1 NADH dehydrogenase subunit 2 [Ampullaceana lagotis]